MDALIFDHDLVRRLIDDRKSRRIDRQDEIWDGTYVIMPPTDNAKQEMIGNLGAAFDALVRIEEEGWFYLGINVSDRVEGWEMNLRCPDFAVYLRSNPAQKCGTHWCGGPDFAVEIVTPGDHTRDKLGFYGTVNTRELLVVDRHPWELELFRGIDGKMVSAGRSTLANGTVLTSDVFPVSLRLVRGEARPRIEITHKDGRRWVV
jgi:Uma2 family endonuclease